MTTSKRIALAAAVIAVLSAAPTIPTSFRAKVAEIKSRPGGRIEPLPEVKPYETFAYAAADHARRSRPVCRLRPMRRRVAARRESPREFLEQFSLDTPAHGGHAAAGGRNYGLVQTRTGWSTGCCPATISARAMAGSRPSRRQDLAHRDRSGRHGRLHRAPRCTRAERMISKETRA